jgi:hypothetical protein
MFEEGARGVPPEGGNWPDASNRHQRDEVVPSVDSPELIGGLRLPTMGTTGSRTGFPRRSNQYKCLSWPGGHRSRPARNAVSCCWTRRWSAYYPSVQSPAWAPPAPGKGERVTADQHDLTTDLTAESPSSEGLSRVPEFSERLPRDGRLPGPGSRPAAPGSNEPRPEDNSQDRVQPPDE